jgi:hypothetical protein
MNIKKAVGEFKRKSFLFMLLSVFFFVSFLIFLSTVFAPPFSHNNLSITASLITDTSIAQLTTTDMYYNGTSWIFNCLTTCELPINISSVTISGIPLATTISPANVNKYIINGTRSSWYGNPNINSVNLYILQNYTYNQPFWHPNVSCVQNASLNWNVTEYNGGSNLTCTDNGHYQNQLYWKWQWVPFPSQLQVDFSAVNSFTNTSWIGIKYVINRNAVPGSSGFDFVPQFQNGGTNVSLSTFQWLNQNWNKTVPINITNTANVAINGYWVPINVSQNVYCNYTASLDFSCIRFTDDSMTNQLSYWREVYKNNSWAQVWVNVSSLAATGNTTIYMYYQNLTQVSDGSTMMLAVSGTHNSTLQPPTGTAYYSSNGAFADKPNSYSYMLSDSSGTAASWYWNKTKTAWTAETPGSGFASGLPAQAAYRGYTWIPMELWSGQQNNFGLYVSGWSSSYYGGYYYWSGSAWTLNNTRAPSAISSPSNYFSTVFVKNSTGSIILLVETGASTETQWVWSGTAWITNPVPIASLMTQINTYDATQWAPKNWFYWNGNETNSSNYYWSFYLVYTVNTTSGTATMIWYQYDPQLDKWTRTVGATTDATGSAQVMGNFNLLNETYTATNQSRLLLTLESGSGTSSTNQFYETNFKSLYVQPTYSFGTPINAPPALTYSLNSTNSTLAGTPVQHDLYWSNALSGYIFSFYNGTNTTWYNQSASLGSATVNTTPTYVSVNTGWMNATNSYTLKGNGWASAANAYTLAGTFATNKGSSTNQTGFFNFGTNLPGWATVLGIGIKYNSSANSASGTRTIAFQISNNSLTSYKGTIYTSGAQGTSFTVQYFGSASDLSGLIWNNITNVNNISINVSSATSNAATIMRLDYVALNITWQNATPVTNQNSSYVTYNSAVMSDLSIITNMSVTINVSNYSNPVNGGGSNPDLWLEVYNGTIWSVVGNMTISGTGNDTVYIPNQDNIYKDWQANPADIDIRIMGRYLDANQTMNDSISWSQVWINDDSTGMVFVNDTWIAYSSSQWSNVTKTVNSTVNANIQWCIYANDTNSFWNSTSCIVPFSYLTTTSGAGCVVSTSSVLITFGNLSVGSSGQPSGQSSSPPMKESINATVTSGTGCSVGIYSTNNFVDSLGRSIDPSTNEKFITNMTTAINWNSVTTYVPKGSATYPTNCTGMSSGSVCSFFFNLTIPTGAWGSSYSSNLTIVVQ